MIFVKTGLIQIYEVIQQKQNQSSPLTKSHCEVVSKGQLTTSVT